MVENYILTHSGLRFYFDDPRPEQISISDIAHALSNICRFTGHTKNHYSVAEHCVRASRIVPKEFALETLLHDAAEAYLGDVSTPLKRMLPDYKTIETNVELVIAEKYGIPYPMRQHVKHADLVMLATEKRDLLPCGNFEYWDILDGIIPLDSKIIPHTALQAERSFLERFNYLTRGKNNEAI